MERCTSSGCITIDRWLIQHLAASFSLLRPFESLISVRHCWRLATYQSLGLGGTFKSFTSNLLQTLNPSKIVPCKPSTSICLGDTSTAKVRTLVQRVLTPSRHLPQGTLCMYIHHVRTSNTPRHWPARIAKTPRHRTCSGRFLFDLSPRYSYHSSTPETDATCEERASFPDTRTWPKQVLYIR
jgi:hypothetical protein